MNEVVFDLTERVRPSDGWHYLVVAISFTLIGISRFSQRNVLESMALLLFKSKNIRSFARDTGAFNPLSGVLLTINFILTSGYLTYLLYNVLGENEFALSLSNSLIVLSPVMYVFATLLLMVFVGWIIGTSEAFKSPITIEYSTTHIMGFTFSFILLIYVVEARIMQELLLTAFIIFVVLMLWRIVRSVIAALRKGAPWYYIILYLCTLEILPLLVVYHSFGEVISGRIISN
jgi:hypothetical protein